MKKLISSFLALVLAFSTIATVTFAKGEPLVTVDEYKEALVTGLNLVDKKLSEKENITRADFALVLMTLINEPLTASATTSYADVSGASKKTAAIEKARAMGLMVGVGENLFAPDQPILYSQAVTLILRATKNIREFNGEQIITGENYERLTKGIGYADTRELDYPTLVKVLYNALSVTILKASFDKPGTMSAAVETYETIPEYFFNYKRVGGVLYADAYSSILSTDGNGSTVTIGNGDYKSTADYNSLLGFTVDGFVDEDNNVVCIAANEDNNVLKVDRKSAIYSNRVYSYDVDGSYKHIKIDSGTPIAYNDRAMLPYDETKMIPQDGYTMLIDNNDDDIIDVVRVIEYVNIKVTGATTKENKTELYDESKGINVTLLANADANTTLVSDSEGNKKEIKSIKSGALISVIGEISTNPTTGDIEAIAARRVIISGKIVEGAVELKDSDEGTFVVNGETYTYDSRFDDTTIGFGRSYIFALDFMGNVAVATVKDGDEIPVALAYVIDVTLNSDNVCVLKVVTPYDKIIKYECADKVKVIDPSDNLSAKLSNHSDIYNRFYLNGKINDDKRLIGYTVDDERMIDKIQFANMDYAPGGKKEGPNNIPSNFGIYGTSNTYGQPLKWYAYFNTFYGKVTIDDNTILFAVPEAANMETATDEEFKAIRKSDLIQSDAKKYEVQGYVFGKDSEYADVAVVRTGVEATVDTDSRTCVIKGFKQSLNEDDEVIFEVTVIENPNASGVEKTYAASDAVISSSGKLQGTRFGASAKENIKDGNIVAMATDALGEISAIEIIARDKDTLYDSGDYVGNPDKISSIHRRLLQANVYSINNQYATLANKSADLKTITWADMEQITIQRCAIVVVEEDAGKTTVRLGTVSDIDSYKEKGKSSDVLMYLAGYISYMLIVYK